jgi:long-subunit fatty acid transport protein
MAASAAAQPLTIPRFDFSFSNPGARSLGFGGAFAALADDATAAYANPAGLVQLAEPEVSLEARQWNRSPSFISGGRVDGEPTGIGLDTREGLLFERDHSRDFGPSFASVVIPMGRWSFALFGHQLARFEVSAESQGFFFEPDPFTIPPGSRFWGSRETVDLEVVTAGLAAGWRMSDQLSFGLGIIVSDASLETRSEAFLPDDDSVQSQYGEISFLPERRISRDVLSASGTDVTVNAGMLGRISEQLSAGLFYRQGAKVRGTVDFETGPAPLFPELPPVFETFQSGAIFQVPSVGGGGLAWRSRGGRVTLATEVDHVGYEGLVQLDEEGSVGYLDAWEYHVGAEYALLRTSPIIAFRAGSWIEAYGDDFENESLTHLSAGFGIAARSYQIDLAADFSDEVDTASLSFIYTY